MDKINLTELSQKAKCNKYFALGGVLFVLLLSFALIVVGLCKYKSEESIAAKTITTKDLSDKPACGAACCMLSHKVVKTPVEITETSYDNTANILLYVSVLVFMFLSLWGTFTILLKALKSENEINSKILDVKLGVYKEGQMWELTKEKKDLDLKLEKDSDIGRKYRELETKKLVAEYEQNEKQRLAMKKDNCQEPNPSESK